LREEPTTVTALTFYTAFFSAFCSRDLFLIVAFLRVKVGDDWITIYIRLNLEALREKYMAQLTDPIEARPTWQDPA
jgi:hypothetical protein